MLLAAPGWVVDAGVIFGALVAFGTFCGIVARSPIGRWFAHQLTQQAEEWVERISREAASHALQASRVEQEQELEYRLDELIPKHMEPVLYELRSNGGASFRDQVLAELKRLPLRHDRVAIFMDDSAMDRRELREMFLDQIARTALAEQGEVDDREEDE